MPTPGSGPDPGRVPHSRTSGERDETRPRARDRAERLHPDATDTFDYGEAEALLLWPREVGSPATVAEAGLWPVFVMVVEDPEGPFAPGPLLELLDRPRRDEPAVVAARCRWSILDHGTAVLKVTVRTARPRRFLGELHVPARQVVGVLDVVARGATIGVTTDRHVGELTGRVDIRTVLREVVLLRCEPSADLATLADLLGATVSR